VRMLAKDLRGLIAWGRMVDSKAEVCQSFCRRVSIRRRHVYLLQARWRVVCSLLRIVSEGYDIIRLFRGLERA